MFTGKFIALNVYVSKLQRFKIDDLSFHFKKLHKNEQITSEVSWRNNKEQKLVK